MRQEVKKAKIKDRCLEVELIEHRDDNTENEVIMKCKQLVHNDMLTAFAKLKIHLVKLCDLREGDAINPDDFDPEEMLTNFKVSSFSVSGNDDNEGVTVCGSKELASGKILNLVSPFQQYQDENAPYAFSGALGADIQACIFEVEQYLFEGKVAIKQLEMFSEEEMTGGDVHTEEPKKRGRKKKEMIAPVNPGEITDVDFEKEPVFETAE